MNEEQGVISAEDTATVPTENNGQVQEPVEGVTPTTDGKDYKAIAEQLSRDIKEKNRKIQELKSRQTEEPIQTDDTAKRFIQTEANAYVAMKTATDPSFKDLVPAIMAKIENDPEITIAQAEREVKAEMFDRIMTAGSSDEPIIKPKQLTPTAMPEPETRKTTGNVLDDVLAGHREIEDPAILNVIRKYRA